MFTRKGFHSRRGRPKDRQYGNSARPDSDHLEESKGRGPKCYRCKRFGHIAKQCQKNKKFDESNVAVDCQKANEGSVAQDNIALSSTMKCALSNGWYVDSGATSHMTYDRKILSNFREFQHPSQVYLGDDKAIFATGQGSVKIACYDESYPITLTLENVLYVPKLRKNLLSVAAIAKKGAEVKFDNKTCTVIKDKRTLVIGHIVDDRLYRVNTVDFVNVATSKEPDLRSWHCRFGHLNHSYIDQMIKKNMVEGLKHSN